MSSRRYNQGILAAASRPGDKLPGILKETVVAQKEMMMSVLPRYEKMPAQYNL
jgi:hypothetical protein